MLDRPSVLRTLTLAAAVLAGSVAQAAPEASEPEIAEHCRARTEGIPTAGRSNAEATCRTLLKGALDAFAARRLSEGFEHLRLIEQAVNQRYVAKTHASDIDDPFRPVHHVRPKPESVPVRPRAAQKPPSSGDLIEPFGAQPLQKQVPAHVPY